MFCSYITVYVKTLQPHKSDFDLSAKLFRIQTCSASKAKICLSHVDHASGKSQ